MAEAYNQREFAMVDLSSVDSGGRIGPVTPGHVLLLEFMQPLGLSAQVLARQMEVPVNRITKIIRGERSVTARTALALASRFDTSPEFWLNLQTAHDLDLARAELAAA